MKKIQVSVVACMAMFLLAAAARAASISSVAFDNATVQAAGPRTGASGKAFFNMEGTVAGGASFRSFGAADFNFGALGVVTSVSNVHLLLTEANAAFTAPGNISVYPATNTASNIIQPGDAAQVKFQDDTNGLPSVDPTLLPTTPALATYAFATSGNTNSGQVDDVPLSFSVAQASAFLAALNSGSTFRIVITPDDGTGAATFAGYTNSTAAGPTISFDYESEVPEPSTVMLLAISLIGLLRSRSLGRN